MGLETTSIAANLEAVRERIARAAQRARRRPEEITLVAVSKTFPAEGIRLAYAAGVRHFGENRVQEWEAKQPLLADLDAAWHLVGHLQSNTAVRAARLFHSIDSVDSVALAHKLARALGGQSFSSDKNAVSAGNVGAQHGSTALTTGAAPLPAKSLAVLIEVSLAPEETKSGTSEAELPALAEAVLGLAHLDLRGLMSIPPYFDDPEQARPYFRKLRELRDVLSRQLNRVLPELSMGMSHDFEAAIEEGATQVRLGTAIFGPRKSPAHEE